MKKLSETYKELGIAFTFPIKIKDSDGNLTYYEDCTGYWRKSEYDSNGNETYYENSKGYWYKSKYDSNRNLTYHENRNGWQKREYDADGNETYYENRNGWYKKEYDSDGNETYYEDSKGRQQGTSRKQTCEGKVVEIDGIKYELKLKN